MEHPLWLIYITVVVLLLRLSSQYQQQTFYIKPANSTHCPVNVSSLDLPTFVMKSHQLLSPITSLLFLPGSHLLKSTLQIANITEFTISIYNDSSIGMRNGASVWITCLDDVSPSIHIENVSFVRMGSISFYQCGSLLLRSIPYSVIVDSIIMEHKQKFFYYYTKQQCYHDQLSDYKHSVLQLFRRWSSCKTKQCDIQGVFGCKQQYSYENVQRCWYWKRWGSVFS